MKALSREFWFLCRDKPSLLWLFACILCASVSILLGSQEVHHQRATLETLIEADRTERALVQSKQSDWGSAAYYTFHLTYDAPSDFAFASLGQRDLTPWKHRIRMLALEGQIYESDVGNPEFALIGRFDYAFAISLLAPLLLILLLYHIRASERSQGRHDLLIAISGSDNHLWLVRSGLRILLVTICFITPLWIGGIFAQTSLIILVQSSLLVGLYLVFWWGVFMVVDRFNWAASVNLFALLGIWFALGVGMPAMIKYGVDIAVPVPDGGDILLTQREAVNDAWDLPKNATMEPFVARHPDMADFAKIERTFEWKWYYAFQQVGDQKAETLSKAYRNGRLKREALTAKLAWLSPPSLIERKFQSLAGTDVRASLLYEDSVRQYHRQIRTWYYPRMFPALPFDRNALQHIPEYSPVRHNEIR